MSPASIVVAGIEPLGALVAEQLAARGQRVVVLANDREREIHGPRLEEAGVRVLSGAAPWIFDLKQLDLVSAAGLVLCADDDSGNVDTALAARHLAAGLRIFVRISDPSLHVFMEGSVDGVEVFDLAGIAAPATVSLALHRQNERVGGLLAWAATARQMVRGVMPKPSALFWSVFTAFLAMLLPTSLFFSHSLDLSFFDAMYFVWTTVLSVGYGDIALKDATDLAKGVGMAVMLLGAAFTAALVGLMADWLLTRRLGSLFVRVSVRMTNHVVVCGAGSFGVRVAELLRERGHRVVVIERTADGKNVQRLRSLSIPVVIGDATLDDTLDLASAWSASIVLAMTNQDAVNLHLGLRMQRESVPVPVIARLRSRQLTDHVDEHCGFTAISPLLTATEHVTDRVIEWMAPHLRDKEGA
ncbi:MAG: NAD-binding protein [Myxococcales bacterium]|nr:NAD-binding protein [Myxococcales bacterium]